MTGGFKMELRDLIVLPDIEECNSILCVQPHPDDNEVGAGATIAKLAAKGCKITYLTVTDGSMGTTDPNVKPEELAKIRRKEAEKAAASLGVSQLIFLDYPDGSYADEKQLAHSIVSVIRKVKPEIVLTVDPFLTYEVHPDHRSVGMAAAQACLFSMFPGFKAEGETVESSDLWTVDGIAFHSTLNPNTFVDIDDTWDKKLNAIAMHESQFDENVMLRLGYYFDYKARAYAEGKGFNRAEAFKVLTVDCLHMNVDAINL